MLKGSGFTIAGPGRVGQSIGKLLNDAGVAVRFIAARRMGEAHRAVRFIGSGSPVNMDDPRLADSEVVLLTVADAAVGPLAEKWAKWEQHWCGKVVLHTSGALSADVLKPLTRRGASIGSFHPFQTVPSAEAGFRNLRGAFWAVEGDARARRTAIAIAQKLGGHAFRLRSARKILYHAGAVLSCGAVVALLDLSARMLRSAGVPAKNIRPMLGGFTSETFRNFVALGAQQALTGPVVRGDWNTVVAHLRALRRHAPDAVPVYRDLVRVMARLAGRKLPAAVLNQGECR